MTTLGFNSDSFARMGVCCVELAVLGGLRLDPFDLESAENQRRGDGDLISDALKKIATPKPVDEFVWYLMRDLQQIEVSSLLVRAATSPLPWPEC